MDPVPDPILSEKFLGYSWESNPEPLGWQSDVLTTIPNRQSWTSWYAVSNWWQMWSGMESSSLCMTLRPGADQSSKAAFCKSAFAKSKLTFGKSAFARSRFAFRQSIFASQKAMVWPSATSKMLSAKMCQNLPKRAQKHFCFLLDWCAPCHIFNKRKHVLAKTLLPKAALLDWCAPGLIVPRAFEISHTQPCIKCRGKSATHFVYF